jgi:hypothetical protein
MLKLEINAEEILSQVTQAKEEAKKDVIQAVEKLTMMTYGFIVADAEKLPDQVGRAYRKALHQPDPVSSDSDVNVWIISLDESAMWIEEHLPEKIDMKPNLLKGKKYVRVPFRYASKGGGAVPRSSASEGLLMEIKQVLKDKHGKDDSFLLKTEKSGKKVKTGKLHEFDMSGENRFMSWKKRNEKETHPLKRLSIFQTQNKAGRTKRDVLVFRTVSAGDASTGKWMHPGLNKQLMDAAMKRAEQEWESIMKPELERKWAGK